MGFTGQNIMFVEVRKKEIAFRYAINLLLFNEFLRYVNFEREAETICEIFI